MESNNHQSVYYSDFMKSSFFSDKMMPLLYICRRNIRKILGRKLLSAVSYLGVPKSLQNYLLFAGKFLFTLALYFNVISLWCAFITFFYTYIKTGVN